jgi:hypothetical protein
MLFMILIRCPEAAMPAPIREGLTRARRCTEPPQLGQLSIILYFPRIAGLSLA